MWSDYTQSGLEGQEAEFEFVKAALKAGRTPRRATYAEQMRHIDFILDDTLLVEVKGMKRTNRYDATPNMEWTWLEFKNVRGDKGWLLGDAQVIAFEMPTSFALFARTRLLDFAKARVDFKTIVQEASDAKYCLYRREGRKDILSRVEFSEMLKLKHQIWEKVQSTSK